MTAEEEVRAAWKYVDADKDYLYGTRIKLASTGFFTDLVPQYHEFFDASAKATWQAALDFTRKRQQEIAEIDEEIAQVEGAMDVAENTAAHSSTTKTYWYLRAKRRTEERHEMSNEIHVPAIGEEEMPLESVTEAKIDMVLSGLLVPSQGLAKAMAREVNRLRAENAELEDHIESLTDCADPEKD